MVSFGGTNTTAAFAESFTYSLDADSRSAWSAPAAVTVSSGAIPLVTTPTNWQLVISAQPSPSPTPLPTPTPSPTPGRLVLSGPHDVTLTCSQFTFPQQCSGTAVVQIIEPGYTGDFHVVVSGGCSPSDFRTNATSFGVTATSFAICDVTVSDRGNQTASTSITFHF